MARGRDERGGWRLRTGRVFDRFNTTIFYVDGTEALATSQIEGKWG